MSIVVFLLGFAAASAGLAALLFGISIIEFSLGGTLVTAGSIGFVGGLLMIAMAAAMRELGRIADALPGRLPPRFERPGEAFEPYPFAAAPGAGMPSTFGQPRGRGNDSVDGERPPDPLPRTLQFQAVPEAADPPAPAQQPAEAAPVAAEPEPELRPAPDADTGSPDGRPAVALAQFDTIWPKRERITLPAEDAPAQAARGEPEPPHQAQSFERQEETAETGDRPVAQDQAAGDPAPRPVSILKSGVVDGMAYTLYSDGSIEAELPDGTIRFASIDELRTHLEKTA
jgi:hypothetical protein